ncbi:unnamed protein product [Caenorhabditis bovis]|uniref:DUF38 domain-containing protein n=1 Tax=Caenorhabditis bovis TaxID=2654633 RepID=A0A8S1EBL9_9PELO|nr:unnamed protein product [Caenorhabditis bovis]
MSRLLCLCAALVIIVNAADNDNITIPEFPIELPDGSEIKSLPESFEIFNGLDEKSRVIANKDLLKVLFLAKSKSDKGTIENNPFTIGELLSHLYEQMEWGEKGPPGGFTFDLEFNTNTKQKREALRSNDKYRVASLEFTKKSKRGVKLDEQFWKEFFAA